ncbi:MAG: zinc-ribbon domain containing protein [Chloroflexi bacterium]|nr:zinc-ribbon domain containing protein [Chloroflexota bacterium]
MGEQSGFKDKWSRCVDCGQAFLFSEGEQRFFWSKGLEKPKRCPDCRELRKRTLARAHHG